MCPPYFPTNRCSRPASGCEGVDTPLTPAQPVTVVLLRSSSGLWVRIIIRAVATLAVLNIRGVVVDIAAAVGSGVVLPPGVTRLVWRLIGA